MAQDVRLTPPTKLRPFGEALHYGLDNARVDRDHTVWAEEDYCSLAMERASALERYFDDITVENIGRKKRAGTGYRASRGFGDRCTIKKA